jgi:N-acetylglucosamine malate deacetylase 1
MQLDLLAFGAHPDDVELACAGTIYKHLQLGFKVGIVDLTQGELGSRGTAETRKQESDAASKLLGLTIRDNLGLEDGFFENNKANQLKVIKALRKYRPNIVLINAPTDRHPDHGKGALLLKDACFLSGLIKIETFDNEQNQAPWRPKKVFHYIQDQFIEPSLVIDISNEFNIKMQAIQCYGTQFLSKDNDGGPTTYISTGGFMEGLKARAIDLGKRIGVSYGEGFINVGSSIGLNSLFDQVLPDLT